MKSTLLGFHAARAISVLIAAPGWLFSIQCSICKMSLLFRALYAKCPYYLVLCIQSVLVSSAYYLVTYMVGVVDTRATCARSTGAPTYRVHQTICAALRRHCAGLGGTLIIKL